MAVLKICKYPDPILKQEAGPIVEITDDIHKLAEDMIDTMREAPGAGLAAPQVGQSLRIIVIEASTAEEVGQALVVINPEIIRSDGSLVYEEGCLSVIDYSAKVTRANQVLVRGLDIDGNPIEIEAEGRMAVVFQHEIDHLNGILFIDRISSLKREIYRRRLKKALKKEEQEARES
jgi:peptide deformylase